MSNLHHQIGDILRMAIDEDWSRFDLAAALYRELTTKIRNESAFLGRYCTSDELTEENPNLGKLHALRDGWAVLLAGPNGRLIDRVGAYRCILSQAEETELTVFEDDEQNELTLLWYLLVAIDLSCTESGRLRSEGIDIPPESAEQGLRRRLLHVLPRYSRRAF